MLKKIFFRDTDACLYIGLGIALLITCTLYFRQSDTYYCCEYYTSEYDINVKHFDCSEGTPPLFNGSTDCGTPLFANDTTRF